MKRMLWTFLFLSIVAGSLTACGGGGQAAPEPGIEEVAPPVVEDVAAPSTEENSAPPAAEVETPVEPEPAEEEMVEVPVIDGEVLAGRQASGFDPETGLEINPDQVVPGSEFMVVAEIVSFNLVPQDRPEFVVIAPSGTRYRIHTQGADNIFYEDGTKPAFIDYKRGLPIIATVQQEADAGATIEVTSSDFTILQGQ
ncbi:MAG: hypothetical protein R6X18_09385 [Chloroflexota bacterium]|jgi:hypothetical protein